MNILSGPGTSFNAGNFIGLTQQLAWFEKDLIKANENRAQVPWLFVAGHRPFYSSQSSKLCLSCRLAFDHLLYQYDVDIYFSGHAHWYERFYPIEMNTTQILSMNYTNITTPIYISNGGAGNPGCGESNTVQPLNFSAKIIYQCGYGQLIVYNSTHARWNFYLSVNQTLYDQIDIVKQHNGTINQGNQSNRLSNRMKFYIFIIMFLIYMDI
jgi:acid phosphatase